MIINIAVEKKHAHFTFDHPTHNFPFEFNFMDRTTGTLVDVALDLEAFKNLYKEMGEKLNLKRLEFKKDHFCVDCGEDVTEKHLREWCHRGMPKDMDEAINAVR